MVQRDQYSDIWGVEKIIFLDLNKGTNKVIRFPDKYFEFLRPIILNIPKKNITKIN